MTSTILFICGSLAPGKNGVGDYSRLLVAELLRAGVRASLIATHDREVNAVDHSAQTEGDITIPCIRIPVDATPALRLSTLQERVSALAPDWISLQYVPHAYSTHGFPFAFLKQLRVLNHNAYWHVMFHELWIENHGGFSKPKELALSVLGKRAARFLRRSLQPTTIHTHVPYYQRLLAQHHFAAQPLPLIANIPRVTAPGERPRTFRAAFFSQMRLTAPTLTFLNELARYQDGRSGTPLEIVLLGGGREKVERTATSLRKEVRHATVNPVGFLEAAALSRWLQQIDLGISPVKSHLVGKSGTVAAFLSHGLPVAVPVVTEHGFGHFDEGVRDMVVNHFSPDALDRAQRAAAHWDASRISLAQMTATFQRDLQLKVNHSNNTPQRLS